LYYFVTFSISDAELSAIFPSERHASAALRQAASRSHESGAVIPLQYVLKCCPRRKLTLYISLLGLRETFDGDVPALGAA
jgi:hypothetical protein